MIVFTFVRQKFISSVISTMESLFFRWCFSMYIFLYFRSQLGWIWICLGDCLHCFSKENPWKRIKKNQKNVALILKIFFVKNLSNMVSDALWYFFSLLGWINTFFKFLFLFYFKAYMIVGAFVSRSNFFNGSQLFQAG